MSRRPPLSRGSQCARACAARPCQPPGGCVASTAARRPLPLRATWADPAPLATAAGIFLPAGQLQMRPAHRPAPRHRPSPARRSLRSNFTSTASSPQLAHSPRRRGHHLRRVCVVLMPVPRHMPWLVKHVDKHRTRTNDITHASQPRAGGSEPCHWLWTQSETQECVRV